MKKRTYLHSLAMALLLFVGVTNTSATPTVAIDLDPTTPAVIEGTLTALPGVTFTANMVVIGDGVTAFDTVILDVLFNDAGSALTLNGGTGLPTAGTLAGPPFGTPGFTFNLFPIPAPTNPGLPLGTLWPPGPGSLGVVGLADALAFGGPIGAGVPVDIFSVTFGTTALGTSTISAAIPPGGGLFSGGFPVPVLFEDASVNVVPEPGTLALLSTGILGLAGYGWHRRKQAT